MNDSQIARSGITIDGNPVMRGAFVFVGTHGLPIEIVISKFEKLGWVIDWADFIASAKRDRWKPNTISGRIIEAMNMVRGRRDTEFASRIVMYTLEEHK